MDFDLGEDRRMIADSFRRFVAERMPFDPHGRATTERGHDPAAWAGLAELGLHGALFNEASSGFGGGGFDIMAVFEEVGRGLVVEPLLGTLMAGAALASAGGQDDALASLASGEAIAALAHDEAGGEVTTSATREGDGWRIDGAKTVVTQGEAATLLLVSARTPLGLSLFLAPADAAGIERRGYANIDGGRSAEIGFYDVRIPLAAVVGGEGAGFDPLAAAEAAGLLALSAEALGLMETIKTATLDYLRTRQQFGVPIGRFQALQHRMADVLLEVEGMRSAVINAAAAYDEPPGPARSRVLSAAKYSAGRIGRLVAEEAVQLHGGIGMTWELPLSHSVKRLTMIDHQLGDEDTHLSRYIALGRAVDQSNADRTVRRVASAATP